MAFYLLHNYMDFINFLIIYTKINFIKNILYTLIFFQELKKAENPRFKNLSFRFCHFKDGLLSQPLLIYS